MDELQRVGSLLARYEGLDSLFKAYVAGYADDALNRLEVALNTAERVQADRRASTGTRAHLRCVHSRSGTASNGDAL